MLKTLIEIEARLPELLSSAAISTMHIDYHDPIVNRVWFQYNEYRVYLHKIFTCKSSMEALFHPHPWKSAVRIIRGGYEMGVGHSSTNDLPVVDCRLLLSEGAIYEMLEPDGWHYVNPIGAPCYSIMVTGELNNRPMPVAPMKSFRELTREEVDDILQVVKQKYLNH